MAQTVVEKKLSKAAGDGDIGEVKAAIAAGAIVDTQDTSGWTPLLSACRGNHTAVARLLLGTHGANTELHNDVRSRVGSG